MAENNDVGSDVWRSISKLDAAQARSDEQIASLAETVNRGFQRVEDQIGAVTTRVNQPVNLGLLMAVTFGLLGLFGGYSMLLLSPVSDRVGANSTIIAAHSEVLSERGMVLGRQQTLAEWHTVWLDSLNGQIADARDRWSMDAQRIAQLEGEVAILKQRALGD